MAWLKKILKLFQGEPRKYLTIQDEGICRLREVVEETPTQYHVCTPKRLLGMMVPYADKWIKKDDPNIFHVSVY